VRADEALWGLWLVPFGLLVIRSGFIPKIIGVLLLVASVGYVAMSAAYIGFPSYVAAVDRVGMILIQGELSAILWLLIVGARRVSPSQVGAAPPVNERSPAVG
jgi:purine-cytosine permease-like protein